MSGARRSTMAGLVLVALAAGGATQAHAMSCVRQLEAIRGIRGIVAVERHRPRQPAELLPGVAVKVRRGDFEASTVSDEDGYFTFQDLPPGDYELTAYLEGFSTPRDRVQVRDRASRALVLVIEPDTTSETCSGVRTETLRRARRMQEEGRRRRPRG